MTAAQGSQSGRRGAAAARAWIGIALALCGCVALGVSLHGFAYSAMRVRVLGFFDFPIFLQQAATFLETGELYPAAGDAAAWAPGARVYKFPPLYALLMLPVVGLAPRRTLCEWYWWLQIATYSVAVGLTYLRLREGNGGRLMGFVLLILALNFQPFFETLWGLQAETLLLLLLVLCLGCVARGNDVGGGVALGLSVMLKIYPAPLLVYFLARRRFRALLAAAVTMLVVLLVSLVVIGPRQNAAYFFEILPVLLREPPLATTENVGIGRYLQRWWGVAPAAAGWMSRVPALALLAASALLAARRPGPCAGRTAMLQLSLFVPVMLLALPNSWTNYQLLLLPPLLVLVAHALADVRRRTGLLALSLAAYAPMLFLRPCEITTPESATWPCSATPALLGLFVLPGGLHDLGVSWRGACPLLLWLATACALWLDGRSSGAEPPPVRPRGRGQRHRGGGPETTNDGAGQRG